MFINELNRFGINTDRLYKFKPIRGVYFLCLDNKVKYIGKSVNVAGRVTSHVIDPDKIFDTVFIIECINEEDYFLEDLEKVLINYFNPPNNKIKKPEEVTCKDVIRVLRNAKITKQKWLADYENRNIVSHLRARNFLKHKISQNELNNIVNRAFKKLLLESA